MNEMAKDHLSDELSTYKSGKTNCTDEEKQVFDNINEASSFWRELWEKEGESNDNAEWLQEITASTK